MKTSNPLKRDKYKISIKRPISAIPMISGGTVKDVIAGVNASCTISGTRYGLVKGVVADFGSNVPPVEDAGLRACPAFTQLAKYTEDLTNEVWGRSNILTPSIHKVFQGQNIWNLPENTTASVVHQLNQSVFSGIANNSVIGCSIVAKYNGRKIFFSVNAKDGTYKTCRVNLQTGVIETNTGIAASCTSLGSGYYRLFFAANVLTGATAPSLNMQYDNGISNQYTGDGVSGVYIGQPTYINFGVNGIPFIPPYAPNNTDSPISVVSEAGGASNGTGFDLDDTRLAMLKKAFRGIASGTNLWAGTVQLYVGWSDNGTEYVSAGGNNSSPIITSNVAMPKQMMEITLTTGAVASGTLLVYVSDTPITISSINPNTTYIVRGTGSGTVRDVAITSGTFIGSIVKSSISVRPVFTQGHLELEFVSNFNSAWFPNNTDINFFTMGTNIKDFGLYYRKDNLGYSDIKTRDSASTIAKVVKTLGEGQSLKIILDWGTYTDGTQKMRLTVDGVKSSVVAFSGSFGTQDLRFFSGNIIHAGWIKKESLKIMPRPIW